ncbi:hypothetical protein DTO212C5_2312 [Paecilomyces variotii]|nr:hypothetical protein DTO212C5_2312 [Paecilomyces variotii]
MAVLLDFPVSPLLVLALIDERLPSRFSGLQSLRQAILERENFLRHGGEDQYLSFSNVKPSDFRTIESRRVHLGRGIAFTYFGDIETLIIKVPTKAHEKAHASIGHKTYHRLLSMGIGEYEFWPINAARYRGGNSSSKEGDSAYQNQVLRPHDYDWPNFVIEAGYSENIPNLHMDARWWIENSGGQVLMVILIWISPRTKTVLIEKWIPSLLNTDVRRSSRIAASSSSSGATAVKIAEISINQAGATSVITGAPLVLEFDRLVGRLPQHFNEGDVVYSQSELDYWARGLWIGL